MWRESGRFEANQKIQASLYIISLKFSRTFRGRLPVMVKDVENVFGKCILTPFPPLELNLRMRRGVSIRIFPPDKKSGCWTGSGIQNPDIMGEISGFFFWKKWVILCCLCLWFMLTGTKKELNYHLYEQTMF